MEIVEVLEARTVSGEVAFSTSTSTDFLIFSFCYNSFNLKLGVGKICI